MIDGQYVFEVGKAYPSPETLRDSVEPCHMCSSVLCYAWYRALTWLSFLDSILNHNVDLRTCREKFDGYDGGKEVLDRIMSKVVINFRNEQIVDTRRPVGVCHLNSMHVGPFGYPVLFVMVL